jgi:hypothetical protein
MKNAASQLRGVRCPVCESGELRRSRIRFWEEPLKVLGILPYRCLCCWYRGHVLFLPFRFMLQLTMRGTARRFEAIVVTAVTELLPKLLPAPHHGVRVFRFTQVPLPTAVASRHPHSANGDE